MWNDDLPDNSDKYKEFLNEYVLKESQNQHEFISEKSFFEIISFY